MANMNIKIPPQIFKILSLTFSASNFPPKTAKKLQRAKPKEAPKKTKVELLSAAKAIVVN